jgi:NAD/NADP transhydrogenase beta subunit
MMGVKFSSYIKHPSPNKILNHGITYNTLFNRLYYLYFRIKNAFESQNCKKRKSIAAAGMTIAILGTIFLYQDDEGKKLGNYVWILEEFSSE